VYVCVYACARKTQCNPLIWLITAKVTLPHAAGKKRRMSHITGCLCLQGGRKGRQNNT